MRLRRICNALLPGRGVRLAIAAPLAVAMAAGLYAAHAAPAAMATKKDDTFQTSIPAAVLLDPESDSLLFEKNGDQLVAPASLAKLMTLEYVFNEIKQGRLKLDDTFKISENAWRKGGAPSHGSTMFAAIHSDVKVDDLIHGIIVDSANDACIAIAEGLAGNEAAFGALLTKRAREIGLEKSTFTNAEGFPDPDLRVTAREMAELARHIMQTYPDFFPYFAEREFTWNNIRQQNRNPLLGLVTGADGMKTGETAEAGFNLVGTALQDNFRLIVVVTGAKSDKERADEAKKMLEMGFHGFEARVLFAEGQNHRRRKSLWRRPQLRAAARARHRQGDDAAQRQRAAVGAHRLYRSGAGADHQGPADRQADGMARREFGPRSAADRGRGCRHRHHVATRHGRRHRADDRAVQGRRE